MPFHLHLTPKKIQQIFRTHDSIHTQDQAGVVVRQKYAAIVVSPTLLREEGSIGWKRH